MMSGLLGTSKFSYAAGTAGTVTVPQGATVVSVSCVSVAGGSLTIAAGGPNQPSSPSAGSSIPIPANGSFDREWAPGMSPLGGGTVFTFTSTDSYYIEYATIRVG